MREIMRRVMENTRETENASLFPEEISLLGSGELSRYFRRKTAGSIGGGEGGKLRRPSKNRVTAAGGRMHEGWTLGNKQAGWIKAAKNGGG